MTVLQSQWTKLQTYGKASMNSHTKTCVRFPMVITLVLVTSLMFIVSINLVLSQLDGFDANLRDQEMDTRKIDFDNYDEELQEDDVRVTKEDSNSLIDLPIIIWWTSDLYPHHQGSKMSRIKCHDGSQCFSTNDRSFLHDVRTRGFLFYGSDINPNALPLPRNQKHEWALFHEESPMNNYMLSHEEMIKLFNYTATFRRESDYPLTTQNMYSLNFLTKRKEIPLKEKNSERKKRNLASVMYVQSHSGVASDRDRYVKELMKYIDIDSYGTCLHNKDLPPNLVDPAENFEKDEFLDFISIYKFHLAFENAVCDDYMTEKLTRPLHVGSIPIYYGSPKVQDWMPNNSSIIMVTDFQTPQELAKFIQDLDTDDTKYEEYMRFKKPGGITNKYLIDTLKNRPWGTHDHIFHIYNEDEKEDYFQGYECHFCQGITKRLKNEQAHQVDPTIPLLALKMANMSHMGCPVPFSSLGSAHQGEIWPEVNWRSIYKSDKYTAKAVHDMVESKEENSKRFHLYVDRYINMNIHAEL